MVSTRYKLKNTFHGTTCGFTAPHNHDGALGALMDLNYTEDSAHKDSPEYQTAHRKLLRIRRELCGMRDCRCGAMIREDK